MVIFGKCSIFFSKFESQMNIHLSQIRKETWPYFFLLLSKIKSYNKIIRKNIFIFSVGVFIVQYIPHKMSYKQDITKVNLT